MVDITFQLTPQYAAEVKAQGAVTEVRPQLAVAYIIALLAKFLPSGTTRTKENFPQLFFTLVP